SESLGCAAHDLSPFAHKGFGVPTEDGTAIGHRPEDGSRSATRWHICASIRASVPRPPVYLSTAIKVPSRRSLTRFNEVERPFWPSYSRSMSWSCTVARAVRDALVTCRA